MVKSAPPADGAAALRFLQHLWFAGDAGGDDLSELGVKLTLWRPKARTEFFTSLQQLVRRSLEVAAPGREDVYFSACGLRANYQPPLDKLGSRGTASDIGAVPALYVDFDVKPGAFARLEDLHTFLDELPLPPSARIGSGTGAHAYWALKEPWELDTPAALTEYDRLARGWVEYLRRRSGVHIDPMTDAARVLRLPGTLRIKGEAPRPVTLMRLEDNVRYNPSDFREYAVVVAARSAANVQASSDLSVDWDAEPPGKKFMALMCNDERFADSVRRKPRRDLKDNSPSAHDMSLAAIAVRCGWTDQEIIDMVVSVRRQNGDDRKYLDWYTSLALKVRAEYNAQQGTEAAEIINQEFENLVTVAKAAPSGSEERRTTALEAVKRLSGIELSDKGGAPVIRYSPEPYRFAIRVVAGGKEKLYNMGTAADILNWQRWIQATVDLGTEMNTVQPKNDKWRSCVNLLSLMAENENQAEFSEKHRTEALVLNYLRGFGGGAGIVSKNAPERHERAWRRSPYTEGMNLYLSAEDLLAWMTTNHPVARNSFKYSDLLALGFSGPRTVPAVGPSGQKTTRKYRLIYLGGDTDLVTLRQTVFHDLDLPGAEVDGEG